MLSDLPKATQVARDSGTECGLTLVTILVLVTSWPRVGGGAALVPLTDSHKQCGSSGINPRSHPGHVLDTREPLCIGDKAGQEVFFSAFSG